MQRARPRLSAIQPVPGDGTGTGRAYVAGVEVDRDSGVPAYRQIAGQLRDAIRAGELAGRLPSARSIAGETGVGILTARKALRVLTGEGWATVTNGLGTFAASPEDWPEG
jgi:DNA-binding transcriptional regulator YhcF (GntR family)